MKQIIRWSVLATSAALVVGGWSIYNSFNSPEVTKTNISEAATITPESPTFNLASGLPVSQRLLELERRSQASELSLDRSRSRYVLANIYLANRRPQVALALLNGLDQEYPILAEYISWKRSQALAMINPSQAKDSWNQILSTYPQGFAAAEALNALGRSSEVLAKFPSHPRSRSILKTELAKNPNRFELLTQMAVYFNDDPAIVPIFNRLITTYKSRLNPSQWSAIAKGYFERREYGKANLAYAGAEVDPDNLYLWGRSLQRANRPNDAKSIYSRLVQQFPTHPLAPRAVLRMIDIASAKNELPEVNRLSDRLVTIYPDTAAEGLLKKVNLLEKLGNNQATTTRNLILARYPQSNEAGILAWRSAQQLAKNRNYQGAIALSQKIITNNPQSEIAAEAGYWGGKWAKSLGDQSKANRLFQAVISKQPDSYFAWRSAVQLGWQVGDFTTLRNVSLPLNQPQFRQTLPAGSAVLQELYILGQDQDASDRWQFETRGKSLKTAKAIFTDGVLRVGVNDNLRGLRQIESMYWLDVTAQEKAEIKQILQQPTFRQSLYPLPYWEQITQWSSSNNLPVALVVGLIRQESRFESQIVSSSGAIGLMQIMPDTGAWISSKKKSPNYSLNNPAQNVEFGTWYLDYTHRKFGDNTMLAVASYNAGPGRVQQWVNAWGAIDPDEFVQRIPYDETKGYVERVLGNYWNYLRLYSPQIQQQITQTSAS
ncbi:soluble lytic murein transglycosylase-like protein [Synechococcus sp. PCC 7502]|uniref:lytic transglycosylase domain-containing protein n=1 Tax=Synechococcus sp. PCC 7502 TaxID=1173263 RepID=UPI00029FD0F7|nr:transglycosylase SLT domain-containing protein [Synechococcus sp. PCC 7502]AFY74700.1 soluble lytic murein transglycosylase-like protein [Synechococcus sp. PCC 7502]